MTAQKMPFLKQGFGPVQLTRVPGNIRISDQVRLYVASRPQLLEGYAGCLELLAQELSVRKSYPKPRWVISRGEVLTSAGRRLLEEVFECPVVDFYNSEEIGNMAWECRDRPGVLHVNTDAAVLELLDEYDDPVLEGVEGRVVLTNLYNQTMPFIRYDIGDHATWEIRDPHPCSCGAVTPTLSAIHGRTDDFIVLPNSRRVSPLVVLTTVLNGTAPLTPSDAYVPQVLQFQVVQEEIGQAIVRVVPSGAVPEGLQDRLAAEFRKLHPDFSVRVSAVERIRLEPSGKLKRIINRRLEQS